MRRFAAWLSALTDHDLLWIWRISVLFALTCIATSTVFLASLAFVTLAKVWFLNA